MLVVSSDDSVVGNRFAVESGDKLNEPREEIETGQEEEQVEVELGTQDSFNRCHIGAICSHLGICLECIFC